MPELPHPPGIREAIVQARLVATRLIGSPVTVRLTLWENETLAVEAFHTHGGNHGRRPFNREVVRFHHSEGWSWEVRRHEWPNAHSEWDVVWEGDPAAGVMTPTGEYRDGVCP